MPTASGTLSSTSDSLAWGPFQGGDVAVQITGTWSGSVPIQTSLDGGTTWAPAASDGSGTPSAITANTTVYVPIGVAGMRIKVGPPTAWNSGTADVTLAWGPPVFGGVA